MCPNKYNRKKQKKHLMSSVKDDDNVAEATSPKLGEYLLRAV